MPLEVHIAEDSYHVGCYAVLNSSYQPSEGTMVLQIVGNYLPVDTM